MLIAIVLLAACSSPAASIADTPSPTGAASCRLPVWWPDATGSDIHVGLVPIPGGGVTDPQTLSLPDQSSALSSFQFYGATYFGATGGWKRLNRSLVSPDGRRYAYWDSSGTNTDTVHVLDLASGADTVIYSGSVLYFPIAWLADGVYVVNAVAPRQGAFKGLFRLDPAGDSAPQPVTGADRHMYQSGWVLVADGAAWGIDNTDSGNGYAYSVIRLDLTTFQANVWFGPTDTMFWPLGVDLQHRLYISDGQQLVRINGATAQRIESLTSPGSDAIYANESIGGESGFVADASGVWLGGSGGVWLYSDAGTAIEYTAGPADAVVYPAGPCS